MKFRLLPAAILVATQTVEVGINLDADVLVSESASWDALVQLGSAARRGELIATCAGRARRGGYACGPKCS